VNRRHGQQLRSQLPAERSGKTAFITALVKSTSLPCMLVRDAADERCARRTVAGRETRPPSATLAFPVSPTMKGWPSFMECPPAWPTPTRGVSEIRLALRFRSNDSLLRHFKETSTLYLEIVDYPGEWLLDLPMLAQDYLSWSRQMTGLLQGQREAWSQKWRALCADLDPLAPADENRLAEIAAAWTDYLHQCKREGLHFIQPGRFVLPGDMAGAPALQFFPWPDVDGETKLAQADKHTNAGMLRERYNYYCEHVVKGFYKHHFLKFDRQIVLVDCLQPLNNGPQAFNDMRLALTQLMQSFHYGQRTLFRRLFSPVIDKLLFAATKSDHVTLDQHANMVSLLQQLIQDAWQNAAFEGISMDCMGLASVQATQSGIIEVNGEKIPALRGHRLSDGTPLTFYPGEVPARLPGQAFWDKQGFSFEAFRPQRWMWIRRYRIFASTPRWSF
jgi:Predicted ATPase